MQHLRPHLRGLWKLQRVLRVQEGGLVFIQRDNVHLHRGDGVAVMRQAAVGGLHFQHEGIRCVRSQGSFQPQDPRELVHGEVAAVAGQNGVPHLRVYTCRGKRRRRERESSQGNYPADSSLMSLCFPKQSLQALQPNLQLFTIMGSQLMTQNQANSATAFFFFNPTVLTH